MSENTRRSMRQVEIVLHLEEAPAKSISALAERLDAHRSVISRSLKALKAQGVVFRDRHGWHLTQEGLVEAAEAKRQLTESTEQIRRMAERTAEVFTRIGESMTPTIDTYLPPMDSSVYLPGLSSALNTRLDINSRIVSEALETAKTASEGMRVVSQALSASPLDILTPDYLGLRPLDTLLESARIATQPYRNVAKSVEDALALISKPSGILANALDSSALSTVFEKSTLDYARSAIEPLLSVQATNQHLLSSVLDSIGSSALFHVANQSNSLLSDMLGDVLRVSDLVPKLSTTTTLDIFSDLTSVNQALDRVWTSHISLELPPPNADAFAWQVALPTLTAARYSDSVNVYAHWESGDEVSHIQPISAEKSEEEKILDRLLAALNPTFVEMRLGARSALNRKGPDHLRHAATSLRELVRQVLQAVVPDELLPEDFVKGKPNVKERVKIALREQGAGKGDADFAATMAATVLSMFERLNKYTHDNEQESDFARSVCLSTESTLLLILTLTNNGKSAEM